MQILSLLSQKVSDGLKKKPGGGHDSSSQGKKIYLKGIIFFPKGIIQLSSKDNYGFLGKKRPRSGGIWLRGLRKVVSD